MAEDPGQRNAASGNMEARGKVTGCITPAGRVKEKVRLPGTSRRVPRPPRWRLPEKGVLRGIGPACQGAADQRRLEKGRRNQAGRARSQHVVGHSNVGTRRSQASWPASMSFFEVDQAMSIKMAISPEATPKGIAAQGLDFRKTRDNANAAIENNPDTRIRAWSNPLSRFCPPITATRKEASAQRKKITSVLRLLSVLIGSPK